MDLGAGVGPGLQVGGKLLDPVLAADRHSGGDGLPDGFVRLGLGGGAKGDRLRASARLQGGLPDLGQDSLYIFRNRHRACLLSFYRGILG